MEEVERFTARGDSGAIYTVVVCANMVPFTLLKTGITEWKRGAPELFLADGRDVTEIGIEQPGTYKIVDTEEVIRKIVD